jgi:hypothetical protein
LALVGIEDFYGFLSGWDFLCDFMGLGAGLGFFVGFCSFRV